MRIRSRLVLALMVLMPIIEIVVGFQVAQLIGGPATLAVLFGLSIVGIAVVRHQGSRAFADLRQAAQERRRPERDLSDRVLALLGGVLLAVPGFVTAIMSLPLLLPFTRPVLRGAVSSWAVRHGSMYVTRGGGSRPGAYPTDSHPGGPDVVSGEVINDR